MCIVSSGLSVRNATRFQKALNQRHISIYHLVYYIQKHNKVYNQRNDDFVVEELSQPDITRLQYIKHANKINNNTVNKSSKQWQTEIIWTIQTPVHAGKWMKGTYKQNCITLKLYSHNTPKKLSNKLVCMKYIKRIDHL